MDPYLSLQEFLPAFIFSLGTSDVRSFIENGFISRRFILHGRFSSFGHTRRMRNFEETSLASFLKDSIPKESDDPLYLGDAVGVLVDGRPRPYFRSEGIRVTDFENDVTLIFVYERPSFWQPLFATRGLLNNVRYVDEFQIPMSKAAQTPEVGTRGLQEHLSDRANLLSTQVAYQNALERTSRFGFSEDYLKATRGLSLIFRIQKEFDEAITVLVNALVLSGTVSRQPKTLERVIFRDLAAIYLDQGKTNTAERLYSLVNAQDLEDTARTQSQTHFHASKNKKPSLKSHSPMTESQIETSCGNASTRIDDLCYVDTYPTNREEWEEAGELGMRILEARKRMLGQEHPDTLTSMANLAFTYKNQGRWGQAEELELQVLETRKRILGQGHPDSLRSMANLTSTYRNKGRWKEAEELEIQVMEMRKTVLGQEHPDTLSSIGNLALTFWNQGRWKEAEELEVQVMDMSRKVLGEKHPFTLSSMANLASTFWNQGRWKEAEELEIQVMETSSRVLGEEHPDTLTSKANLASTYRNQGRWAQAEKLEVQVMETRKRVLGQKHPDTLTSMANLALTYKNQGRWGQAEELEGQVMEIRKRVLGQEHSDTLSSIANLASTYRNQGRWKEAEELEIQVMEMRKTVLGQEHPDTLSSMGNLASTFWNQGRWKEAEELQVEELKICARVLGQEHPDTLSSMANLASTFRNQGRWKEAEELEMEVTETRKRVLGKEHPSTLTSMNNLAFTWKGQSRYEEALKLMEECVRLYTRILGPDHPHTLSSSSTLVGWQTEKLETGASADKDAVRIEESVRGISAANNIGGGVESTPRFLFQVNRMQENPSIIKRHNLQGMWLPPRVLFGNTIGSGYTTGKFYYFDGRQVVNWPDLPKAAVLYKEVSMYYNASYFWIVPYNATEYQVGSGRQVEGDPDSDENKDEAEAEDDDMLDQMTIDWSLLSFQWNAEGYTSKVMVDAQWRRLNTQRRDQLWVQELLTAPYHAEFSRHTTDPRYGGLIGDLAILIGLVAFSCPEAYLDAALKHCIRPLEGEDGGWRRHGRTKDNEWQDRHGFNIKVWSLTDFSTNDQLRAMEMGTFGKIYR